jgi:hypothetical protein
MKRFLSVGFLVLCAACKGSPASGGDSAGASVSAARPGASGAPSAAAMANATAVLGGADWHQVFVGEPPIALPTVGGDDYALVTPDPSQGATPWKYGAVGGGGVYWSPTKKAVVVTNINLKIEPKQKTVDLWSKSALIKDLKPTAGPEVIELGPTKAPVLAGAGTCSMSTGEPADMYWYDGHSALDFAHTLIIVIVAKAAPEAEKQVALSVLRGLKYTAKAKPTFKK